MVLAVFLMLPIVMIVIVSFWRPTNSRFYPAFQFDNYQLPVRVGGRPGRSSATPAAMPLIVWALTLVIGFTVAYFLAFHVRTLTWQIVAVR